jgi:hypothetical protein
MTAVDQPRARVTGRTLLVSGALAIALVVVGIALFAARRVPPERAPMAVYYLSMVCRCPWHNLQKALQYVEPGVPWSIRTVPGPYRYRVLIPWLTGFLPFAPETSLSLVTYVTLGVSYLLMLLATRRLGWSMGTAAAGLLLAYVFEPNLDAYFVPYRLDGLGLMVIAAMLYALTVDSFWLFAVAGVAGVFAREVTLLLLPLWCVRDLKRGVSLTAFGVVAWVVARQLLYGPPDTISPQTILMLRLHNIGNIPKDLLSTWNWAFPMSAIGLLLVRPAAVRTVIPVSLGLFVVAGVSYLLGSDTMRLFLVLLPAIALAATSLITVLLERRQRLLLLALLGLVILQLLISQETPLSRHPAALAAAVRPLWLGTLWSLWAAFALRQDVARGVKETLLALRPSAPVRASI